MNETETRLQTAGALLERWTDGAGRPEPDRLDVRLAAANLAPAVAALHEGRWGYLSAITGLDLGPEAGQIEVLYHFCAGAAVVTLRVSTPRDRATVPSICGVIASAGLFERELSEMLGVSVTGTPVPERLFLPDDWPEGVHPLRKDFSAGPGNGQATQGGL